MKSMGMRTAALFWAPVALMIELALAGCGTPGAPMPPSLKLPDPVTDLAATRIGDQVALTWTMPRKSTDKLLLKESIPVRICRRAGTGPCAPAPGELTLPANAQGSFTETLPTSLASGPATLLTYFVELRNGKGRSAGMSNGAAVVAGAAPGALTGLRADLRKTGVVLMWTPESASVEPLADTVVVRLQRKLLTLASSAKPAPKAGSEQGLLAAPKEPVDQSLIVEPSAAAGPPQDEALDKSIHFGNAYEYRAQRVARVTVGSQTLELAGPLSEPVRVEAQDVFPPDVPAGLAAVATAGDTSASPPIGPSIDLSWQPVADPDIAGYVVYRREGTANWERISPMQALVGPGFHDAHVEAGHTYQYAVSAVDEGGRESAHSQPAEERVPAP
jgi:hypothetical protein